MTEVSVTRITRIEDPKLRQFAEELANSIMGAAWKAAAHHHSPQKVALPAGDTLERRFLDYLRGRPKTLQTKLAAKGMLLVQQRQVPGLAGLDLTPARPTLELTRDRLKLTGLNLRPGVVVQRVPPTIEGGLPTFRKQSGPTHLEFLMTSCKCIDETNGFLGLEGGDDEIAIGGVMVDAAGQTLTIPQTKLGDFGSDGVHRRYDPPKPLGKLNFLGGSGWPKSFSLVLTLVELDNGKFPELLQKLFDETRKAVVEAVDEVGTATFGEKLGDAIVGAVEWVLDNVFDALRKAWEDDLFAPATFNFSFPSADARFGGADEIELAVDWRGHGGRYDTRMIAQLGPIATAAHGALYKSLGNGDIRRLRQHERWRRSWTEIVPLGSTLLFYDAAAGEGEFWRLNSQGGMSLLRRHTGWRKTWRHIVPGHFSTQGGTDLLFYDPQTGVGAFYAVNADGTMQLLRQNPGWRKTWTCIVPGNFGGNGFTDLLFYDASKGEAEFHATDGAGDMGRLAAHDGWRRTWAQIVPGSFGGDSRTDLLFYDASKGEAEFYAVSGGNMARLRQHSGWRKSWAQIVPGDFGGNSFTDLLFYDRQAGAAEVYRTDGKGDMQRLFAHSGWRKSWSQIVATRFTGGSWSDLVFYDPSA